MQFGKKFNREEEAANAAGGSDYIRNFKDGTTVVRFLQELQPEDQNDRINGWTGYWECYNPEGRNGKGAYYPSPGKNSKYNTERVSRRYLVNCLVDGKVAVYKVPASLMDRITRRSDKYETITDRDYEITRSGKGINTEYDIEAGDRGRIDIAAYADQLIDHDKLLSDAFVEAWGELPSEEDDNQDVEQQKAQKALRDAAMRRESAEKAPDSQNDQSGYDDPPSEPQRSEGGAAEETVLTEEQIRDMSRGELLDLAESAGLEADKDKSRVELADWIIDQLAD